MDTFEFELRYVAYKLFARKYHQDRGEEDLINLVAITDKWVPDKKVQDLTPDELRDMTLATYTSYKKTFLEKQADIVIEGWDKTVSDYIQRLEYEMKVIKEMGFNTYMLVVQDFVNRAKDNGIVVWPWRWSWAWSLLAFCLGITDIDPLPFDLLFERFLNPARVTMPDFDIDFDDENRERVIEYVSEKYGRDKVCAIGTYMKLATKAAFKDSARVIGIPFDRSNLITWMIGDAKNLTMALEDQADLRDQYNGDSVVKEAIDLWVKLEWNLRQLGVHACGVIISPDPVTDHTPVQFINNDPSLGTVSQLDGPTLESLWLLKMDFLGLRNLSVIKNCIKIIAARHKQEQKELPQVFQHFLETTEFHPPLDDATTYEKVFQSWDTTGIFQFEWQGMRNFLVQLEANDINDLVAMSALYRPGPMEFIPVYIARKHGEEDIKYMLPELEKVLLDKYDKDVMEDEKKKLWEDLHPIMSLTYGIAVYQEQLMFLVQRMAWFSLAEADILRRWVGKKKKDVIEKIKAEFNEKGQAYRNYKPETLTFIYEKMIEPAASYSFNKSHSVCYAYIAYQTWYLKAHYPLEFYAALLRSIEEDNEKLSFFVKEVQQHGISVRPASVSDSFIHVAAVDNHIRLWFLSVKGIGTDVAEFLEKEQKNWPYRDIQDVLTRLQPVINKRTLESLIKSWALDDFGSREQMWEHRVRMADRTKSSQDMSWWLFGMEESSMKLDIPTTPSTLSFVMSCDMDMYKCFVTLHPFDSLYPYIKKNHNLISQFEKKEDFGQFSMLWIITAISRARKKWFFVTIEDIVSAKEFFIKDMLDLKLYDVLIVSGFKGKNASIEKIIRVDIEELHKKMQGTSWYDASMTALRVKQERMLTKEERLALLNDEKETSSPEIWETSEMGTPDNEVTDVDDTDDIVDGADGVTSDSVVVNAYETVAHEADVEPEHVVDDDQDQEKSDCLVTPTFELPENMSILTKVIGVIKTHRGSQTVSVWWKDYQLSDEWIQQLKALLW